VTPWDTLAAECARRGDHAQAYAMACKAGIAREQAQQKEAGNRAVAMAARLEIEHAQAEREQVREQAALAAQRASLLQATHTTLEQLGRIGREITAQLDVDTVFSRIYGHLHALVDAPHLSIWLLDEAAQVLHMRFGIEEGQTMAPACVAMPTEHSNLARCLREDRELEHDSPADAPDPSHLPGTLRMQTGLFGPLRVRGRTFGVMSIQSPRRGAYGERERLVFRTLCAYGAIALDNAAEYAELNRARGQLQDTNEAERQARWQAEHAKRLKSAFLAEISQALRTPLRALHEALGSLLQPTLAMDTPARRAYLDAALRQSRQVNLLARELLDLARLESGAVEIVPEPFSLADLIQDVLHKFESLAVQRSQHLSWHFAPGLPEVMADIAMIERVLSTFIDFALRRCPAQSRVEVHLRPVGDTVQVALIDDGPALQTPDGSTLFARPTGRLLAAEGGSLGLAIARQMLLLHGSPVELRPNGSAGCRLEFGLRKAPA
jgi:K+-sensing histidine kinase KdpD